MDFGIIFLSIISYFAIMGSGYLIFYGFLNFNFSNKRIKTYYEIIIGFILGIMTVFATLAGSAILKNDSSKNIFIFTPIVIIMAAGIFISPYVIFSLIFVNLIFTFVFPLFINNFIFEQPNSNETLFLIFFYVLIFVFIIMLNFLIKSKRKILNYFYISSAIFFIIVITAVFQKKEVFSVYEILNWYIYCNLMFFISAVTDKIYKNAISLSIINDINNDFFISSEVLRKQVKNYISENKTKTAIIFTFEISGIDKLEKLISPLIKNFIWKDVSAQIRKSLEEEKMNFYFFLTNYKMNSVVVPIDDCDIKPSDLKLSYEGNYLDTRKKEDILKKYESIFSSVKRKYLIEDYKIKIKLNVSCSIMGIHSNNHEKVIRNNISFLNNNRFKKINLLNIHDPNKFQDTEYEDRKLKTLNSLVTVSNASILYEKMYDIVNKDVSGIFINYILNGNVVYPIQKRNEDIKLIYEYGLFSYMIRFLSFKALKELKKNITKEESGIFINYDSKFLASENFSSEIFLEKLNKIKFPINKIVLTFDINIALDNYILLQQNIDSLKKHGIKISVLNLKGTKENLSLIPYFKPDFAILDSEFASDLKLSKENKEIIELIVKICNKIDCKVVAQNVKYFIFYKTLQSLGVHWIFGELIGSSTKLKFEITKEQKILLSK